MTEDPNRKSLRQFQCRDYLWDTFEQMSQDLECSVDYLINEAMRHYARSQGKLRQTIAPGSVARPPVGGPPGAPSMGMSGPQRPMSGSPGPMPRTAAPPPMGRRQEEREGRPSKSATQFVQVAALCQRIAS